MRVLLLTQDFPPRPGGMARYYADLARGLGDDAAVLAGSWEGRPPVPAGGARLHPLPFSAARAHRPWNLVRAARAVWDEISARRPDLLLAGNARPYAPPVLRIARECGVPAAVAYHGNDLLRTARRWRDHPLKRRRWEALVRDVRLHLVNSAYTGGVAAELGLPRERVAVVPPEVDTARFRPARDEAERRALRARRSWPEDAVVTLFVGRLVERKGLDDLFAALAGLPPAVRLAVAGPGDPRPWARRAERHGVLGRTGFLGAVPEAELPDLYRAADLFAGPSRARLEADDVEGFGIVFLEAAASGLPVIATRTGGVPEAVADGVNGFLVPPGSPGELAGRWGELAADPGLRARLGRAGREIKAVEFGPGSSAARLRRAAAHVVGV